MRVQYENTKKGGLCLNRGKIAYSRTADHDVYRRNRNCIRRLISKCIKCENRAKNKYSNNLEGVAEQGFYVPNIKCPIGKPNNKIFPLNSCWPTPSFIMYFLINVTGELISGHCLILGSCVCISAVKA